MEVKVVFGEILKELRLEKGLTQEVLAEQSNLGVTFIYKLEKGLRQPTITTLFQIAKGLELTPSTIVQKMENQILKQ